jgi:hypothetical protein
MPVAPLKPNQYLVEGFDHSYDVYRGSLELVSALAQVTVAYSKKYNEYAEYAGEEYLAADETRRYGDSPAQGT